MKKNKLLIFDMDGTLIDSAPSLTNAINFMLQSLGKEPLSLSKVKEFIGNGSKMLVLRALLNKKDVNETEIDKELFEKAHQIFLDYYGKNLTKDAKVFDNVHSTLQALLPYYKMCVVTNKPHQFVQTILSAFELDKYFDFFVGANENLPKKPDPAMLFFACEKAQTTPKNSFMIGDSKNDLLAAKNANIKSIALSYGYNNENLQEYHPIAISNDFSKLKQILL